MCHIFFFFYKLGLKPNYMKLKVRIASSYWHLTKLLTTIDAIDQQKVNKRLNSEKQTEKKPENYDDANDM